MRSFTFLSDSVESRFFFFGIKSEWFTANKFAVSKILLLFATNSKYAIMNQLAECEKNSSLEHKTKLCETRQRLDCMQIDLRERAKCFKLVKQFKFIQI